MMKAVRCQHGEVCIDEVPRPRDKGIVVDIVSAGICGSDLHLLSSDFDFGVTMGHEMAGRTPDGSPVAIESLSPCGHCGPCREGAYNLCLDGPAIILSVARDGGMAEKILVPERALVPLDPAILLEDACLIEPLAVAVHGMPKAGVSSSTKVAVVGGGSIGLCAVAAAQAQGADVMLRARHDHQCEIGERLGALVNGDGDPGYDVVIDCAGTCSALNTCLKLARPGAKMLLLACYWEDLQLNAMLLTMKEIEVIPAYMCSQHGSVRDIDMAVELLALQPELPVLLISHRFPLDAAREAFATAAAQDKGAIKVVIALS